MESKCSGISFARDVEQAVSQFDEARRRLVEQRQRADWKTAQAARNSTERGI